MPKLVLDYITEKDSWVIVIQCDGAADKLEKVVTQGMGAMLIELQRAGHRDDLVELGDMAKQISEESQAEAHADELNQKFPLIYLPE